jgi:hypothetical protein
MSFLNDSNSASGQGALRSRAEAIENKCMHDALHALSAAWLACLQLITTSLEDSEGGYGKALKNCRARLNAVRLLQRSDDRCIICAYPLIICPVI